jgi:hypothetical protein
VRPEQAGWDGHVQCLVGSVVVVGVNPGVDGLLGGGQGLERSYVIEEFGAQCLVEAFDLAGRCGRARLGVLLSDAVLAADPFEEDLDRLGSVVAAGELLAVVGQHLEGHSVAALSRCERRADRTSARHRHHRSDHDEP